MLPAAKKAKADPEVIVIDDDDAPATGAAALPYRIQYLFMGHDATHRGAIVDVDAETYILFLRLTDPGERSYNTTVRDGVDLFHPQSSSMLRQLRAALESDRFPATRALDRAIDGYLFVADHGGDATSTVEAATDDDEVIRDAEQEGRNCCVQVITYRPKQRGDPAFMDRKVCLVTSDHLAKLRALDPRQSGCYTTVVDNDRNDLSNPENSDLLQQVRRRLGDYRMVRSDEDDFKAGVAPEFTLFLWYQTY